MEHIQRRAAFRLLSGFTALLLALLVILAFWENEQEYFQTVALMSVSMLVLTLLHRNGWQPARFCVVVLIDVVTLLTLPANVEYLAIVIPVLAAWALADWRWILASGICVYGGVLLRSSFSGPYANAGAVMSYMMIVGGLLVGSHLLNEALAFTKKGFEVDAMRATTAAFAHQVNQPLAAALGYVQLFQITPVNERNDADLASIQRELERVAILVRAFNAARTFTTEAYANDVQMLTLRAEDPNGDTKLYE